MFMVLSSWHSHCESSLSSFDECRLSAGWPPTLRPNQPIWAVSPPKDWLLQSADTIAIYYYYSARTHFTVPRRVEGWVDLCTAVRVHNPCPRLNIAVTVVINTTGHGEIRTWVLSHAVGRPIPLSHCEVVYGYRIGNRLLSNCGLDSAVQRYLR